MVMLFRMYRKVLDTREVELKYQRIAPIIFL